MTSHEFAKQLLEGPDLPITTPTVKAYDFDSETTGETPIVEEMDGMSEDEPCRVLVISYRKRRDCCANRRR